MCQECFYLHSMCCNAVKYVCECPQCKVMKGYYTGLNTQLGLLVTNNPMDLMCIDFM